MHGGRRKHILVAGFVLALSTSVYVGSFLLVRSYLRHPRTEDSQRLARFYELAYRPLRWWCTKADGHGDTMRVQFWGMGKVGDHYESDWPDSGGVIILPTQVIPAGFDLEVESRPCRVERRLMLSHLNQVLAMADEDRGHTYVDAWSYRIVEILAP
jgi:hypothetical protein